MRRFLISLGPSLLRGLRGLGLCLRLHLHSPKCIGHVPTLRFRVERLPRGPGGLRLPNLSIRFEAFPAVYRAPSLIWHRLVMNSQSFSDSPDPRGPTNSHSRFSVSPAKGRRPTRSLLGRGGYRIRGYRCLAVLPGGEKLLQFTAAASSGPWVFLPSMESLPYPIGIASVLPADGSESIPGRSIFMGARRRSGVNFLLRSQVPLRPNSSDPI